MITLNKNTKKAVNWIDAYYRVLNESMKHLSVLDFYKSPSHKKIHAESLIRKCMSEEGGKNYRVLGGNSCFFTCGYMMNAKLVIFTGFDRYEINL